MQELSYDAWGNRRDVSTWAVYTTLPTGILLARGFTGHEHLDLFDLINMDGRIYDPVLGRFLSPDPIIQDPDNLQSLNRYTYCLNNPLSLTDPSGYSWLSDNWRSLVAAAVAITVSTITAGFGSGFGYAIMVGAAGGFAGGITGALLSGANLGQAFKAGAIGALIGGVSGGVANKVGSLAIDDLVGKMLAHGITQGGVSELSGGKFEHGFFSAALSAGLAGTIRDENGNLKVSPDVAVASSIVVGGTASVLSGGKFANGAITGAYVMLFNELMHGPKKASNRRETGLGLSITGAGLTAGSAKMFNEESWYSVKQWKEYSQDFNGNGYTGGKITSAKNISTGFKVGGYLLGTYSAYSTNQQYQEGEISTFQMILDQTSNAISTFGGIYGGAWGVGWELGRTITNMNWYQEFKQNTWYPWRQEHLGY